MLYEVIGILAVLFPASFWAIKTFIFNTVKATVENVSEVVHGKLVEVQKDLQHTKENQLQFRVDIEWIKASLSKLEEHLLDKKDE